MNNRQCELCAQSGGEVLFQADRWRVVLVDDAQHPGFCRVIWEEHIKEMTDLSAEHRSELMNAVWQVETAIRTTLQPEKINLATLGNVVPHLHWHVIPRFSDDAQFPAPVWVEPKHTTDQGVLAARKSLLSQLRVEIARSLARHTNID